MIAAVGDWLSIILYNYEFAETWLWIRELKFSGDGTCRWEISHWPYIFEFADTLKVPANSKFGVMGLVCGWEVPVLTFLSSRILLPYQRTQILVWQDLRSHHALHFWVRRDSKSPCELKFCSNGTCVDGRSPRTHIWLRWDFPSLSDAIFICASTL